MKRIILLCFVSTLLFSCASRKKTLTDENGRPITAESGKKIVVN